jgi:hypothetical protein
MTGEERQRTGNFGGGHQNGEPCSRGCSSARVVLLLCFFIAVGLGVLALNRQSTVTWVAAGVAGLVTLVVFVLVRLEILAGRRLFQDRLDEE